MSEGEERKNQRLGILSSIGIHVAMLFLFVFVMGWRAPNPPLSEIGSGIELNFGLDDQGGGGIQPEVPIGANVNGVVEKKEKADPQQPEEKVKPEDSKGEEPLTSQEESPVVVKETKKETKVSRKNNEKAAEVKPKEIVAETKKEVKMSATESEAKNATEEKKGLPGTSQGDDAGKTGDKGNPQGALDAKALYGKQGNGGDGNGGGGGGGVTVTGFVGFEKPTISKPEIPNESYGTYSFSVKVSKEGEVVSIKPITKGISLEAERIFKQTIENTEFVAKVSTLPAESEGIITFKVIPPPAKKDQ